MSLLGNPRSCMRQVLPSDDLGDDDNSGIGPAQDEGDDGEGIDISVGNDSTSVASSAASVGGVGNDNEESDDDAGIRKGGQRISATAR